MMKINGVDVPNTIEELTIEQYDKHVALEMDRNLTTLERWIEKFKALGVDEEVFEEFTFGEMTAIIQEFNDGFNLNPEKITEIEVDGYTYKAKETVSAKDMSLIEKVFNSSGKNLVASTVAILFKREDLTRTEHYDKAHLDHKRDLFKSQPCSIAIPYMNDILKAILDNTENVA